MNDGVCLYCYEQLQAHEIDFHKKCSKKFFNTEIPPEIDFGLDEINELAIQNLERNISIPGVQPKLSLEVSPGKNKKKRLTIVGLWGSYIFKPPFIKYPQLPENEDLTMHLAELLQIKAAEHSLIRLKSGELGYISKRFDRIKNEKYHQEDMAQLFGVLTERKYSGSSEQIGKIILKHSHYSGNDLLRLFEMLLFCFLTGNADMHLKNFSLIFNEDDEVTLSPSYDLLSTKLVMPEDNEDLALPLNGKKKNLKRSDFDKFSLNIKINEIARDNIYRKFYSSIEDIKSFIDKSFLTKEMKENYKILFLDRMDRLGLDNL